MGAADNFFSKAEQALKKRNYDYAIELWQQGLAIDPDRTEERKKLRASAVRRCQENGGDTTGGRMFKMKNMGLMGRIKKLSLQKKFEEQIIELEKLLAIAPQQAQGLMDLGQAFMATDRTDAALQSFTEATEIDPLNVDAWKALGNLYGEKKDVDRAVKCWEKVRAAKPDDNEAGKAIRDLSAAAMMAKAEERKAAAGDDSFRSMLKDTDESEKLEAKGKIIRTADDAQSAVDLKMEEISADKDNPRLHRELGDLYLKVNNFDKTRESYQKALELNPQDPYAQDKLGNLEERILDHGLETAKTRVAASPNDASAQKALEEAQAALDAFMVKELERRVAAHPTDYSIKYRYGEMLFKAGTFDLAIPQFQLAVKDPKFATQSRFFIGRCFYAKNLHDLAIKEFTTALTSIPDADSDLGKMVRYDLAEAYLAKGDKEKALEYFQEIMSVDYGYRDVAARVQKIMES